MRDKAVLSSASIAIIFLATILSAAAQREVDPCRFFPEGTTIRNPDDCSQSLICVNFKAVVALTCSGSTPFYDKETNKCVKALTDHSTCEISCQGSAAKYVADPKSCFGYYYCQDEELAQYGHCPDPYHFNSTRQECIYSAESTCKVSQIDFCAIAKTGTNFNDESDCAKYFNCAKAGLTSKTCSKTYYDKFSGTCIQKSLVDCKVHPYPKDVCGTVKKPIKNKYVKDGATCRGSFYCTTVADGFDPSPQWSQCPPDTFFDEKKQGCVDPLTAVCAEDRCDGRSKSLVVSGDKGCRNYLRCENGVKVGTGTCGNYFFDEEAVECTSVILKYPACIS